MPPVVDLLNSPLTPYAIAALGFVALALLSRFVPTRKEFEGLGVRVTDVGKQAESASEESARALEKVSRIEEIQGERHARMVETMERVSKAMERIAVEQQEIQRQQATTAAEQGALSRDVQRLFRKMDS